MQNSKLIRVLQTLSQVEMSRLDKYVRSPYFHVHADTIRLFELLKKRYPKFKEKYLQQELISQALFPGKPFQKARLYTLKGYLLKLVYQFLADQAAQQKFSQQRQRDLVDALQERQLTELIPKILKEGQQALDDYPYREGQYYYEAYRLAEVETEFQLSLQNRSKAPILQPAVDGLDKFYLVEKLKYACAMINHQQILAVEYRYDLLEAILQHCAQLDLEACPLIGMYYFTFKMQQEAEGVDHYHQLKALLQQHASILPEEEALNLYSFAINFCNRRYKGGASAFLREMFGIFQQMLTQELLFINPGTGMIYYKNIVSIGLKLKEYMWTEQFIRQYKDELDEQHRESIFNYSLALLCFQQQDYRQCTRHLLQVDFIDDFNRHYYYILLLKTYYESDEIEALLSMCNTAITYIRRNQSLSANNQTAYRNFIKFVRTMARIRYNGSNGADKLRAELEACALLVERNWLLDKSLEFEPSTITS